MRLNSTVGWIGKSRFFTIRRIGSSPSPEELFIKIRIPILFHQRSMIMRKVDFISKWEEKSHRIFIFIFPRVVRGEKKESSNRLSFGQIPRHRQQLEDLFIRPIWFSLGPKHKHNKTPTRRTDTRRTWSPLFRFGNSFSSIGFASTWKLYLWIHIRLSARHRMSLDDWSARHSEFQPLNTF